MVAVTFSGYTSISCSCGVLWAYIIVDTSSLCVFAANFVFLRPLRQIVMLCYVMGKNNA